MEQAYIVGAVRTAAGQRGGRLSAWHPIELGAAVLDEIVARTGADAVLIEDVIFGCVDLQTRWEGGGLPNATLIERLS